MVRIGSDTDASTLTSTLRGLINSNMIHLTGRVIFVQQQQEASQQICTKYHQRFSSDLMFKQTGSVEANQFIRRSRTDGS